MGISTLRRALSIGPISEIEQEGREDQEGLIKILSGLPDLFLLPVQIWERNAIVHE
jgi:hypothetical protein